MNIGAVVLAAGEAKRMGMVKQILPVYNTPILKYVVDNLLETRLHPIAVVVGANKEQVAPALENIPVGVIENPFWANGLGTSIRMGLVGSYMLTKGINGLIFLAADMPHNISVTLAKLINLAESNSDKSYIHMGTGQFPFFIREDLFETLLDLNHDTPFEVLNGIDSTKVLEFKPEVPLVDLNTPEDYLRYLETHN